jgi:DNA-binding NtrC family response regulator
MYQFARLANSIKSIGMTESRGREVMMNIENDATLAEAVRKHIVLTLASCGGNRTHAAKILNISLRCLRDKLRGYANPDIQAALARRQKSNTQAESDLRAQ